MAEEFFIPKLGQTVEEVTLLQWMVEDGDKVKHGQEVLEVETDKTTFVVEANASGIVRLGPYNQGDVVPVLTVVAIIGGPEDKFEPKATGLGRPELVQDEFAIETSLGHKAAATVDTTSEAGPGDGRIF